MGGSQNIGEASDNPVEINVTAMVDVIFCLCIFFMCSFHFKQLEGKMETWLSGGNQPSTALVKPVLGEIRVFLRWDAAAGATLRKVGSQDVQSDADLLSRVRLQTADYLKVGQLDPPILVDATPDVPWQEVVHLVDLCKSERMDKIQFVEPFEAPIRH